MIVKSKNTLRNSYDQVLFLAGHEYHAKMSPKKVYVFNELHTETPLAHADFGKEFEVIDFFA